MSSTENSIVFIIINSNNNNPTSQQSITSSQSKNGSGVVVKFNNWVGNCQRNSCAKNCKNENNHTKVMTRKLLASFCGHDVDCSAVLTEYDRDRQTDYHLKVYN